jgi:hypothetical protein
MDQSNLPNAYSLRQFCQSFGVSRSYVYLEIKANRLVVKKAGRRVLILQRDAEAWASALPSANTLELTNS